MPNITEIHDATSPGLDIPRLPWLQQAIGPSILLGKAYLIGGPPSAGKSTMLIQTLGELARQGVKVLLIPAEQGPADAKQLVGRVLGQEGAGMENFYIDTITDLAGLTEFLNTKVLAPGSEYHGIQVIAIDSLQGAGLTSQAGMQYQALKVFIDSTRAAGIACLFAAQITKSDEIAGPKTLQHGMDCILYLRKAWRQRLLFTVKNKYLPEGADPVILTMGERGLAESMHTVSRAATVLGYRGKGDELTEAQASVSIPKYGSRPAVTAPYLPKTKIEQLLKTIGTISGIEALDTYDISCGIPGGANQYKPLLDLAIVTAILSSYLHQPVADKALFMGEVDLTRQIRPPDRKVLRGLSATIVKSRPGEIRTVYVAEKAADELREMRPVHGGPEVGEIVGILGVRNLDELVRELWPGVIGDERGGEVDRFEPAGFIPTAGADDLAS